MFRLETLNELSCIATCENRGILFTKAGAMIGYSGNCKFEKVLLGPQGNPLQAALGQLGRRLTGENLPLMKVTSENPSVSIYADLAQHVTVINLEPRSSLKVESENLLAFTDTCDYGFKFLAQGVISQKGFFTSRLKYNGANAQVAITTNGNPIVMNTPCCVDPDALVAWTGADPVPKLQLSWKNLIGQASGESYVFEFSQPGGKVIIQPCERISGLKLGVDDNHYTPNTQQQQPLGGAMGELGNAANMLGRLLGR